MTSALTIELLAKEHLFGALFSCENRRISSRGKVRDLIIRDDVVIMINTDRISAFDQVLGTIPLKGALLCEQTYFWFEALKHIVPNHCIDRPDPQIMVVKKAQPYLVEIVVRGFLAGSLMREHPHSRAEAYGLRLDPQLRRYQKLDKPIITPSTKAALGEHDLPLCSQAVIEKNLVPKKTWQEITEVALELFNQASRIALTHGLLLVDTKYEFGTINGELHLIDEVHTSDSSRYFLKDDYDKKFPRDETPIMLDKEFVRQSLLAANFNPQGENKDTVLSDELRLEVAKRYFTLTEKITGRDFIAPHEGASTRVQEALTSLIC